MRSTVIRRHPPRRIMRKPRGFVIVIALIMLLAIVAGLAWWLNRPVPPPAPTPMTTMAVPSQPKKVNHLFLGNPSKATADAATNGNNFLIERPQYVLSYNNAKRIPNWVSWQLNASWIGNTPRQNNFRPDDALPSHWYKVKPGDYNNSGYDRGHVTPAADRDNTPENQSATFFMTNILPQTPDNNRGPWERLESYGRELVKQGKELYIVAGSYGNKGTIGKQPIVVPESVWKVIVVMDQPGQRVKSITEKTRVIAVEMPNQQGIKEANWRNFRVSVDQIEAKTGYDLLSVLPAAVQAKLENRVDQP